MKLVVALAFIWYLASVQTLPHPDEYGVLRMEFATFASKRAATNGGGPKSPLLEIVLRILDAIQIVPKKRSRRQGRSLTRPSPLFGRTLLGGRAKQPLMELSLESSETAPDVAEGPPLHGSTEEDIEEFADEHDFRRSHDQLLRYVSGTSERFYDMVLGVLQVLEGHARHEVQRARMQLATEQLAADGRAELPPS